MLQWLKEIRKRWANWVGDRDMERAMRQFLTDNGYYGNTAKFRNVRLVAVQRPGWRQVFRFDSTARVRPKEIDDEAPDPPAEYRELYGLVQIDARKDLQRVRAFESPDERIELFAIWSEDLICLRGSHGLSK